MYVLNVLQCECLQLLTSATRVTDRGAKDLSKLVCTALFGFLYGFTGVFYNYKAFTAQVLKVCRTPGPTACYIKYVRKEKKSMTGPQSCSDTIYA